MNTGLQGKVAMVAGASRGLGFAVARALAKEGVRVSMSSRDAAAVGAAAEKIRLEKGTEILSTPVDVTSPEALAGWHKATIERFGGLDLLFTNSGGPPTGSAIVQDDAAWQKTFELLLLSAVRMVRLAVPSMIERGGGAIVLPTSTAVKEPIANLALSTVMRTSVPALSKVLAQELASKNIRVNHLIPGRIDTDRVKEFDEINAKKACITVEEQRKRSSATIAMGRYGNPDEFAAAAMFLFSDAASYITGATLQVDGGMLKGI
jgi:3-oxoacyl-[acyl-carrier protein] reductase